MNYNPLIVRKVKLLSEEDKEQLNSLVRRYSIADLMSDRQTLEVISIDFIASTAKLEGNLYDPVDTIGVLRFGESDKSKPPQDYVMLMNMFDCFNKSLMGEEVTLSKISELHLILLKGLAPEDKVGTLRDSARYIAGSSYIPPTQSSFIREELETVLELSSTITDPVERAIYLHLSLAYLQPFYEGNESLARMIQVSEMIRGEVMPLLFSGVPVNGYTRALLSYYEEGNPRDYISWFVSSYQRMMDKLDPVPIRLMKSMTSFN